MMGNIFIVSKHSVGNRGPGAARRGMSIKMSSRHVGNVTFHGMLGKIQNNICTSSTFQALIFQQFVALFFNACVFMYFTVKCTEKTPVEFLVGLYFIA